MKFQLFPLLLLASVTAAQFVIAEVRFTAVRSRSSCSANREECVLVTSCPVVLSNIRKRRGNPKVCGWSSIEVPKVCCPRRRTTTTSTTTKAPPTTPRPKHISRISPERCGRRQPDYKQAHNPIQNLPSSPVQGAPLPPFILVSPQMQAAPSPIASPFPIYGKPLPPPIQAAPSPPAAPFPIYDEPPLPPVQSAPSPVDAKMPPPEVQMFPSSGMELPGTGGAVLHEPLLEEVLDQGIEPRATEPINYSGLGVSNEEADRVKIFTVGGDPADKIWPWMVAIFYGNSSTQLCGGTLIDDRHIITAAHCFVGKSLDPKNYRVQVGILKLDEGNVDMYVQDIHLHEGYRSRYYYDDIAILRLPFTLHTDIIPACLPGEEMVRDGDNVTVLGWGDLSYGGVSSKHLQEVNGLPVVSNARCNAQFQKLPATPFPRGITNTFICAGLEEGGKDACQGDSGGPLLYEHDVGYWTLVGVVSFGYKCAEPGFSGVYTKVSSYLPWIENYIRSQNEIDEESREKRSENFEYLDGKPLWKSSPSEKVMFPSRLK